MANPSQLFICEQKQNLFREWQEAFEVYSKTVGEMTEKMGIIPESEFEKLKTKAGELRNLTLQLRSTFNEHITEHGC